MWTTEVTTFARESWNLTDVVATVPLITYNVLIRHCGDYDFSGNHLQDHAISGSIESSLSSCGKLILSSVNLFLWSNCPQTKSMSIMHSGSDHHACRDQMDGVAIFQDNCMTGVDIHYYRYYIFTTITIITTMNGFKSNAWIHDQPTEVAAFASRSCNTYYSAPTCPHAYM